MTDRLTVLIVGGYGIFGGRIVELLENEPRLGPDRRRPSLGRAHQPIATRRRRRGQARSCWRSIAMATSPATRRAQTATSSSMPAGRSGLRRGALSRDRGLHRHAYQLSRPRRRLGFRRRRRRFDAAARAAGMFVLSGVSSFPVLTAAVVRRLSAGMTRVDAIRGGIAPSPYAGVGENVIRAIAGYAGQSVPLRRNGKTATGHPFTEQMRFTIAPPGRCRCRARCSRWSTCRICARWRELWPEAKTIWMGAGPVPGNPASRADRAGLAGALAAGAVAVAARAADALGDQSAALGRASRRHVRRGRRHDRRQTDQAVLASAGRRQ